MSKADEKISEVLEATEKEIISLTKGNKTGKFELSLELNLTEGVIGNAFLHSHKRVRIMK